LCFQARDSNVVCFIKPLSTVPLLPPARSIGHLASPVQRFPSKAGSLHSDSDCIVGGWNVCANKGASYPLIIVCTPMSKIGVECKPVRRPQKACILNARVVGSLKIGVGGRGEGISVWCCDGD